MNINERMVALKGEMDALVTTAKEAARDLTADEADQINEKAEQYKVLQVQAEKGAQAMAFMDQIQGTPAPDMDDLQDGTKGVTFGDRLVKSADFAGFARDNRSAADLKGRNIHLSAPNVGTVDEVLGLKAVIDTSTGQIPRVRETGYRDYLPAEERLTFLDLITTGSTNVPYSDFAQIIGETDNADIVAEGELKPESDIETTIRASNPYVYADGFTITNQTLADDGALAAVMESRVRRHLSGVIERVAVNGTGTGTEPAGILNTTGTLAQAFSEDAIVTLARALETFEGANGDLSPQAIVMNKSDVWDLRLLKDSDGKYLFGNPFEQGPIPTPWGVPLVPTGKVTKGTALVGRFDSFHYLSLDPVSVVAFNQHKDYAQRNLVYVRAETRGRQVFYSPRELVVAQIAGGSGD